MAISTDIFEEDFFSSERLDNETEFKTLVRSIKLSDGFSLFFARSNEIAEQRMLAENLKREFPEKDVRIVFFSKPINHLLDELREVLQGETPFAVLVYGLNNSIPITTDSTKNIFIRNLNASRNSFTRIVDCPLILFLTDFAISAIMRGATDFFSARSGVFYFEEKADIKESQIGRIESISNYKIDSLTVKERKELIKTIEDSLEDVKNVNYKTRLYLRLGKLYLFSADYEKAENSFREALYLSEELNDFTLKEEIYKGFSELKEIQEKYEVSSPYISQTFKVDNTHISRVISVQSLKPPRYFTGREKVLKDVAETLKKNRSASLFGISGIGKSSVVLKYADRTNELYQHIVFIKADRFGFDANIDKIYKILEPAFTPEYNEENKAGNFCRKIEEVCENLSENRFLLLILDNVDEVERVKNFLPRHPNLHILLTSDFEEISRLAPQVEIDNLSEAEAMILLYRKAKNSYSSVFDDIPEKETRAMREITELLGFHPLAISIAGRYINESRITFSEYVSRLDDLQGKILEDKRGSKAYWHRDIYSALENSFNAILTPADDSKEEQLSTLIAQLCIYIASFLAPDKMPEEIFWEAPGVMNAEWKEYFDDANNRRRVYQKLTLYDLFARDRETNTFTIHSLVRSFLADRLENERQPFEELLAYILAIHFEEFTFANKAKVERFLPHVGSFLDHLEVPFEQNQQRKVTEKTLASNGELKLSLENEFTALLCNRYARYYEQNGNYAIAEKYYRYFKNISEKLRDMPAFAGYLLTSHYNLARLYELQGRYDEAEPLLIKSVELCRETLGEDHQNTAQAYHDLAILYSLQGKDTESEHLYFRALEIYEKVFGKEHLQTAPIYSDLARLYYAQGKLEAAEMLLTKDTNIFEKNLGAQHPETLRSYSNLALIYEAQGKYEEAESLYLKVINGYENILGENHPTTASSYMNLGTVFYKKGEFQKALELFEKALKILQNILPANHPSVQQCKESIEYIKNSMNKDFS